MAEFLEKAAGMREKAAWVWQHEKELLKMQELDPACLKVLVDATHALPDLQRQLTKRCFEKFQFHVKERLLQVPTLLAAHREELGKADIQKVVTLMTEAVTAYPLETKFPGILEQAGLLIQDFDKAEVVQILLAACEPCLVDSSVGHDEFAKRCDHLAAKITAIHVSPEVLNEKLKPTFLQVVERLYSYVEQQWDVQKDAPEYAFTACVCVDRICEIFPQEKEMQQRVELIKEALFVVQGHHLLQKEALAEDANVLQLEEFAACLQRRLTKFNLNFKQSVEDVRAGLAAKVMKLEPMIVKDMEAVKNVVYVNLHTSLVSCHKALAAIAGGRQDGASWDAGFVGTTFEELSVHGDEHLDPAVAALHAEHSMKLEEASHMLLSVSVGGLEQIV